MAHYHSSVVPRDTLVDVFRDASRARSAFLVYDDGFRSRTYSYDEVARMARGFAARATGTGSTAPGMGMRLVSALMARPLSS